MHNSIYNHDENELHCKHYISEICYRYGFKIQRENTPSVDIIWRTQDGQKLRMLDSNEFPRNTLWYNTWKILLNEYDLNGVDWAYGC